MNIPELQNKYPQLAPIKPLQYNYEDVEVILVQHSFTNLPLVRLNFS